MNQVNHTHYRKVLSEKLEQYYTSQKAKQSDVEQKGELNGFMSAALLFKTVSREELQRVINAQHFKAFGKGIKQHRLDLFDPASDGFSWDYFDKPVWERERL